MVWRGGFFCWFLVSGENPDRLEGRTRYTNQRQGRGALLLLKPDIAFQHGAVNGAVSGAAVALYTLTGQVQVKQRIKFPSYPQAVTPVRAAEGHFAVRSQQSPHTGSGQPVTNPGVQPQAVILVTADLVTQAILPYFFRTAVGITVTGTQAERQPPPVAALLQKHQAGNAPCIIIVSSHQGVCPAFQGQAGDRIDVAETGTQLGLETSLAVAAVIPHSDLQARLHISPVGQQMFIRSFQDHAQQAGIHSQPRNIIAALHIHLGQQG